MSDTGGVIILIIAVAATAGALLYSRWLERERRKRWPTSWVHVGTPPPGIEVALDVIAAATPGMPKAGTITWVTEPFTLTMGNLTILAAGTVDDYEPIAIRVLFDPLIEHTALAHELGHVWSYLTKQGFGESPYDKRFVAWFQGVNADIARRLGR